MPHKMFNLTLSLCLTLFAQTALAHHKAVVTDAWIADAPPVVKIRAGYLTLRNDGNHPFTVKDFTSEDFERVELHKTSLEDGVVKMEEIKNLTVGPGESIEFKPGGYHLMMFSPKRKLQTGDKVNMQMRLSKDETTTFTVTVQQRGDVMEHDHQHHHHH